MKLQRSPYFGRGICPMCHKSTRRNVHQRCGELREQAHKLRRARRNHS
jgi:hypothetical protein